MRSEVLKREPLPLRVPADNNTTSYRLLLLQGLMDDFGSFRLRWPAVRFIFFVMLLTAATYIPISIFS